MVITVRILSVLAMLCLPAGIVFANLLERQHLGRAVVQESRAAAIVEKEIEEEGFLQRIAERETLSKKWNLPVMAETTERLRNMIEVTDGKAPDTVNIDVYSPNMNEAASLANVIALQHVGNFKKKVVTEAFPNPASARPDIGQIFLTSGVLALLGLVVLCLSFVRWGKRSR